MDDLGLYSGFGIQTPDFCRFGIIICDICYLRSGEGKHHAESMSGFHLMVLEGV